MSLNMESWTPIEVADWISGLDSALSSYSSKFLESKVSGRLLLNLMAGDLVKYGVHKIGDQLLLQDAILTLRNELEIDRTTLQTLSSTLAIRCRNYRSELSLTKPLYNNLQVQIPNNYIPTESLSSASYLLDSAKVLIRWLTRVPFIGNAEYDNITVKLTMHAFELAMQSQRDSFADNAIEELQYLCTKMIEVCELLMQSKDSLIIQPAAVDVITLRKRTEQELGLSLESSYFGLHQVSSVKNASSQSSGQMEKGDEILQVNYQTVLGWPQINLVNLLHENSNEVILTIKRRPRHATNMLGHMYLRPKKMLDSTRRRKVIISPVLENCDQVEELLPTLKVTPNDEGKSEEKSINKYVISESESRFWKLYPRPRNLIKRRATVTGASPTNTRPPVTFVDDDEIIRKRPPLINSKSAPDKILLLRKQQRVSADSRIAHPQHQRVTIQDPTSSSSNSNSNSKADSNSNSSTVKDEIVAVASSNAVVGEEESLVLTSANRSEGEEPLVLTSANYSKGEEPIYKATNAIKGEEQQTKPANESKGEEPIYKATNAIKGEEQQTKPANDNKEESSRDVKRTNRIVENPSEISRDMLYVGQLHLRSPSNPRWTRYRCSLYSNMTLEILKSSSIILKSIQLNNATVALATEVHSRPFAFKIEHDQTCDYLAAESQLEFDTWIKLINSDLIGKKNSNVRAPYKRSVSLGNSPSPRCLRGKPMKPPPSQLSKQPMRSSSIRTTSLKSDWFNNPIRLSQSTSKLDQSNISSITITTSLRKQGNKSVSVACSPLKTSQPAMGVLSVLAKVAQDPLNRSNDLEKCAPLQRRSRSSSSSSSSVFVQSPTGTTRDFFKERCPSCGGGSNLVDNCTQTDNILLFINSQEESRV